MNNYKHTLTYILMYMHWLDDMKDVCTHMLWTVMQLWYYEFHTKTASLRPIPEIKTCETDVKSHKLGSQGISHTNTS